jgi:enterochelin esterase-like enzyme
MKSWISILSVAASLALPTHESLAQSATSSPPPASPPTPAPSLGPVTVVRSAVHRFSSTIVDDVYELRVSVPENYDADAELRPVIYVLDGQWNFTLVSDIVGKLAFDGLVPDPIVVGITWADAPFQPGAERARDFTFVQNPNVPGSGGAANFLKVLEGEVFPLIESTYRATSERVLTGNSTAGLFVSFALLERPDLFTGYVSSSGVPSPASPAGQFLTARLQEITPELLRDERAYFSVGAQYDNEEVVRGFVGELEAALGKCPRIVLDVVAGVGHTGNEPFAYTRGLIHAFQRPRLRLSERYLERYEGDYFDPAAPEFPDLTIEASRGELSISEGGEPWGITFYAATPTYFYAEGINVDLTFYPTDEGGLAFTLNYRGSIYEQVLH